MTKQDLNNSEKVFSQQMPETKIKGQPIVSHNLAGQARSKASFPDRPVTIAENKKKQPGLKPRKTPDHRPGSGSKGKIPNDPKLAERNLKRSRGQSSIPKSPQNRPKVKGKNKLSETVRARVLHKPQKKQKIESWQEEYLKGAKVYKLTAYTTIDNIEKKLKANRRQIRLQRVLISLILIFFLFTVIGKLFNLDELNLGDLLGS